MPITTGAVVGGAAAAGASLGANSGSEVSGIGAVGARTTASGAIDGTPAGRGRCPTSVVSPAARASKAMGMASATTASMTR
ncbi:MAG: hypothetical protein A2138_15865 [Deltaproteobacteria bacterium RBG_16_71_12]|nr:MAG: hypothetical protein A2138_15865 [Deltaproteobacteria bacterium RBG_16_71_12]